ncbi:MAG: epoxyqueuosine reductase QueH [Lachnospiraceae bacterium]|nr:epoxyqueuosine reductase QueH [Lachnospiraceae bacterium]
MNRRNYQKELDHIIEEKQQKQEVPTLFLHACCAPCSSYCLEYLSQFFAITVFYYNPNISPKEEYVRRTEELRRFASEVTFTHPVKILVGAYEPMRFYEAVRGLEDEPEGGERCTECFKLRLSKAVSEADARGFDYVTTTLTISPLKDVERLNRIGEALCEHTNVTWLPSDFKKKNGYLRSIELSKEHDLYRQDYCGCIFSKKKA